MTDCCPTRRPCHYCHTCNSTKEKNGRSAVHKRPDETAVRERRRFCSSAQQRSTSWSPMEGWRSVAELRGCCDQLQVEGSAGRDPEERKKGTGRSGRSCLKEKALGIQLVTGETTLTRCYRAEVSQAERIGKGCEGRLSCGTPTHRGSQDSREGPEGSRHDAFRAQAYLLQRQHSGSAPADVLAEALWGRARIMISNMQCAL